MFSYPVTTSIVLLGLALLFSFWNRASRFRQQDEYLTPDLRNLMDHTVVGSGFLAAIFYLISGGYLFLASAAFAFSSGNTVLGAAGLVLMIGAIFVLVGAFRTLARSESFRA